MVHKIIIIKWGHNIGVDIIIKSVEPGISIFGLANFEYVCEFYAYIYVQEFEICILFKNTEKIWNH